MLPIHPLPPFKAARPLLLVAFAAGATALALWARRKALAASRVEKPVRVEPAERLETTVELPWGTEVR